MFRSEIRIVDFKRLYNWFFKYHRRLRLIDNSMTQYGESYLFFLFSERLETFSKKILQSIHIFIYDHKYNDHNEDNPRPN